MDDFISWRAFRDTSQTQGPLTSEQVLAAMHQVLGQLPQHPRLASLSGASFDEGFLGALQQVHLGLLEGGSLHVELGKGILRLDFIRCFGQVFSTYMDMDHCVGLTIEAVPLEEYVSIQLKARGGKLTPDTPVSWGTRDFSANAKQLGIVDDMIPLVGKAMADIQAKHLENDLPAPRSGAARRAL